MAPNLVAKGLVRALTLNERSRIMKSTSAVYKCPHCKLIVSVLQESQGEQKGGLQCCNEKMLNVTPDVFKRLIFDMHEPGTP